MRHDNNEYSTSFLKKCAKKLFSNLTIAKYARRVLELQDWFIIPTTPEQKEIVKLIKQIKRETRMALNNQEAYQIYITVQKTNNIKGSIAEIGVFKGASAKLICKAKGDKKLYLFDTFEGLPLTQEIDEKYFSTGQLAYEYEKVLKFLSTEKNIVISKGLFPAETGHVVTNEKFSFVHIDVDLYQATKDCLEFFYPRISTGGVILSHDYVTIPGVRKAFDDFFKDKQEIILEPSRSQALVVKLS